MVDLVDDSEGDRKLVTRCLAGEGTAWEEIYGHFHTWFYAAIRGMLGLGGSALSRVGEIASRAWYVLVRKDGELLNRFDPAWDSRLGSFLRALAQGNPELLPHRVSPSNSRSYNSWP